MRRFIYLVIAAGAIIGSTELEAGVLLAIRLRVPVLDYAE